MTVSAPSSLNSVVGAAAAEATFLTGRRSASGGFFGDPTPSSADISVTREVVEACRLLRIAVHDHLIVAGQATTSFKALGLM